jgi:hypothetical protein
VRILKKNEVARWFVRGTRAILPTQLSTISLIKPTIKILFNSSQISPEFLPEIFVFMRENTGNNHIRCKISFFENPIVDLMRKLVCEKFELLE